MKNFLTTPLVAKVGLDSELDVAFLPFPNSLNFPTSPNILYTLTVRQLIGL